MKLSQAEIDTFTIQKTISILEVLGNISEKVLVIKIQRTFVKAFGIIMSEPFPVLIVSHI